MSIEKKNDELVELTEEEVIRLAMDKGLTDGAEIRTKEYRQLGYIKGGKSLKAFIEKLEQKYEYVSLKINPKTNRPYAGKRRVYILGKERDEFVKRLDRRIFGKGRPYDIGYAVDLVQRPEYDAEFCEYMREKYNTYRISQQMVLLEYGYDTYKRNPSSHRRRKSGNYIYRFLNENQEIIYIGLTSEIANRMYQHFNRGHLSNEAYDEVETIEYIKVKDETTMNILETYLINKHQPKHNTMLKFESFNTIDCLDELDTGWKKHRHERREQKDE